MTEDPLPPAQPVSPRAQASIPPQAPLAPAPPLPPRRGRILLLLVLLFLLMIVAAGLTIGMLVAGGGGSSLGGDRVAILPIRGVILDSKSVLERIESFAENDTVKAVVLRVDSPGGGVAPSQEIYDALVELDEAKPVVASFGSTAASGGYYVACAARSIVSNPGTLTGSIGVILQAGNYEGLLEKLGLSQVVVKSGPFKDIMSPARPMSTDERQLLQDLVDDVYEQFLDAVVEGRDGDREELRALADGRIMSGHQAFEAGLVDELGGLERAIELAGELGGIDGEPEVLWPKEPKSGLLERLLGTELDQVAESLTARAPAPGLYFLTHW